jgi:hypothetical protein
VRGWSGFAHMLGAEKFARAYLRMHIHDARVCRNAELAKIPMPVQSASFACKWRAFSVIIFTAVNLTPHSLHAAFLLQFVSAADKKMDLTLGKKASGEINVDFILSKLQFVLQQKHILIFPLKFLYLIFHITMPKM